MAGIEKERAEYDNWKRQAETTILTLRNEVAALRERIAARSPFVTAIRYLPVTISSSISHLVFINDGSSPAYGIRIGKTKFDGWELSLLEVPRMDVGQEASLAVSISGKNNTQDLEWALNLWYRDTPGSDSSGNLVDMPALNLNVFYRDVAGERFFCCP